MMRRNSGDYVKSWGAATIRGAATNAEFTVLQNTSTGLGQFWDDFPKKNSE